MASRFFQLIVCVFPVTHALPVSPIACQLFPIQTCPFRGRRYLTRGFLSFPGIGVTLHDSLLRGFPGGRLPLMI